MYQKAVETDVLVIGGGIAGLFAGMKATERGVDVTLVDKSSAGKSGQTPYATTFMVFNPEWGHNLDAWMEQVTFKGEYVNNREWTEIVFKESYDRYQDLVSWGVKFPKSDGKHLILRHPAGPCEALRLQPRQLPQALRKKAVKSGVNIIDRVMVTDLVKQKGKVTGAIGISTDSNDLYIFKAKATIICMGAGGFKPLGWPISSLTSDGDAIAYRAGAEITGKEFVDTHFTGADDPTLILKLMAAPMSREPEIPIPKFINAEGGLVPFDGTLFLSVEFEAHAGRAPIHTEPFPGLKIPIMGGASGGMAVHKTEGIYPANKRCAAGIPGLYAAGDSCGTMQIGAVYPGFGLAMAGSAVTGARAGLAAAEDALHAEEPTVDEKELTELTNAILAPTERKGGFSPRWVTQMLQNTMLPYYILFVKDGKRMQAALNLIEFMRDHLAPRLLARDAHELRLAHETRSMILNAEMKLRASIFRTESRGCHYREDYPQRDDPGWLAWVKIKEVGGKMKTFKEPIPRRWWPDLSKPYKERYPERFPGEKLS